jgi:hypothetical protein
MVGDPQPHYSLYALYSNAFSFHNLVYTNKNTNNTQKYPIFLLCRCPNHIRRVMSIKWGSINMML